MPSHPSRHAYSNTTGPFWSNCALSTSPNRGLGTSRARGADAQGVSVQIGCVALTLAKQPPRGSGAEWSLECPSSSLAWKRPDHGTARVGSAFATLAPFPISYRDAHPYSYVC